MGFGDKNIANIILGRFRKGESAAGEKKENIGRNTDFEFIFVFCPPQAENFGFSTLT